MPFEAVVTPDDLKKGDLVPAGWYPAKIEEYKEEITKSYGTAGSPNYKPSDGSTNCIFNLKLIEPSAYKGVSPRVQYNEKALGYGKSLWEAVGIPFDPEKGYKLSTAVFNKMPGMNVDVYIKRGVSSNQKEFNEVVEFRKFGTGKYTA